MHHFLPLQLARENTMGIHKRAYGIVVDGLDIASAPKGYKSYLNKLIKENDKKRKIDSGYYTIKKGPRGGETLVRITDSEIKTND